MILNKTHKLFHFIHFDTQVSFQALENLYMQVYIAVLCNQTLLMNMYEV